MAFPKKKELDKIRKASEGWEGTLMLPENPSPLEVLRWDICQEFIKYANSKKLKNIDLAEALEINETEVSRILRHRIDRFSTDRLLQLLSKIKPNHQIHLKVS